MKILLIVALGSQEDPFIAPPSLALETDPSWHTQNYGVLLPFYGKLRLLSPQVMQLEQHSY